MVFNIVSKKQPKIEYDIFMSHNWGPDALGRDNHDRVRRLNTALTQANLRPWFDEDALEGRISQGMAEGIDSSAYVAVFITKKYIDKVAQKFGLEDNCRQEYDYSVRRKGIKKMIPIVMEPDCKDVWNWHGSLGATLANQLYIDYTKDDKLMDVMKEIIKRIDGEKIRTVEMGKGVYNGAVDERGQPHGFGTMDYWNGCFYEGPWVRGKREGNGGKFKHSLGFTYEGSFNNDKKDGHGILTMTNGDRYEGEYSDDKKQGQGRFILANGLGEFEGEFKDGKMTGEGIFTYPDKSQYIGHFENHQIEGYGVRIYSNGNIYEGEWKNGNRHGAGTMSFNGDKCKYKGEWSNDKMEGEGMFTFENGDTYKGGFKNNYIHGHGKYNYVNGAEYEGEYSLGKKCGIGKYTFQDRKQYYYGEWEKNHMEGKGIRYYKNDYVYEGMFSESKRHGWGKMEFRDINIVYNGEWSNGNMDGHGRVNLEHCDDVVVNKKWFQQINPLGNICRVKAVDVVFDEGSLCSSSVVKERKKKVIRRKKDRVGAVSIPDVINVDSIDSARNEIISQSSS